LKAIWRLFSRKKTYTFELTPAEVGAQIILTYKMARDNQNKERTMSRSKCHSCGREFFAHELTEEDSFCAQCQALLQKTFDDIREATRRPATRSDTSEGHEITQS